MKNEADFQLRSRRLVFVLTTSATAHENDLVQYLGLTFRVRRMQSGELRFRDRAPACARRPEGVTDCDFCQGAEKEAHAIVEGVTRNHPLRVIITPGFGDLNIFSATLGVPLPSSKGE